MSATDRRTRTRPRRKAHRRAAQNRPKRTPPTASLQKARRAAHGLRQKARRATHGLAARWAVAADPGQGRQAGQRQVPIGQHLDDVLGAQRRYQRGRRVERDDLAVVHDRHAIGQPRRLFHIVGGQEDGAAFGLERLDDLPDLAPRLRVEPGRRLVETQETRPPDQRARERQPLSLAARELADARARLALERDERHQLGRRTRLLIEGGEEGYRLEHRQLFLEVRLLELHPEQRSNRPVALLRATPDVAEDRDLACRRLREALDHLDGRRLAGAVGTEHRHALADVHGELDAGHREHVGIALHEPTAGYRN